MNDFWDPREPILSPLMEELLGEYSHIPPNKQHHHVKEIRSRAWKVRMYPCIGSYMFLELSMSQHAAYGQVLESLRSGAPDTTVLDLGCCLGQDLRKLVYDGVPGEQLTGYDIDPKFFSVGYEAFQDKSHLQAKFVSGDFLADIDLLSTSGDITSQVQYDFIYAADFFHLWSWEKQIRASQIPC